MSFESSNDSIFSALEGSITERADKVAGVDAKKNSASLLADSAVTYVDGEKSTFNEAIAGASAGTNGDNDATTPKPVKEKKKRKNPETLSPESYRLKKIKSSKQKKHHTGSVIIEPKTGSERAKALSGRKATLLKKVYLA